MTTYNLNCFDMGLPPTVKAGDKLVYTGGYIEGAEVYRLYEDPQRGLRMHSLGDAQAYLAQEREAVALVNTIRQALSGPLADLERQNMAAIAEAELVDLELTYAAACDRWGY